MGLCPKQIFIPCQVCVRCYTSFPWGIYLRGAVYALILDSLLRLQCRASSTKMFTVSLRLPLPGGDMKDSVSLTPVPRTEQVQVSGCHMLSLLSAPPFGMTGSCLQGDGKHWFMPVTCPGEDRSGSVSPVLEGPLLPLVVAMTLHQPQGGKHQGIWDCVQVSQHTRYPITSQHWSNLF